eukprot:6186127-Pleurochrysis_carterae.AAC.2
MSRVMTGAALALLQKSTGGRPSATRASTPKSASAASALCASQEPLAPLVAAPLVAVPKGGIGSIASEVAAAALSARRQPLTASAAPASASHAHSPA